MNTTTTKVNSVQNRKQERGAQLDEGQTRIEIYTDGSCIGNPGHGGWGSVTLRKTAGGEIAKSREASGYELSTTNNRMELTAVCATLEKLGRVTQEPITVFCDANLIPNAMNGWLAKWKANDWKRSGGKAVENRDLWERLDSAAAGRNITWKWLRGHNGSKYNERADRLAYKAALRAEKKLATR
ncbi:ribonuclease H family protein [Phycobacter sp. K97]|uniref:ribonuclease H family protein n=1 Tax=Phycobacter sedimenti TaxID=3133977 RepID=UPI00311F06DC